LLGVIASSPPGPIPQLFSEDRWSDIAVPMLVVIGTADVLPGFIDDWRLHLRSFEMATRGPAYALVFDNQDHYFGGAFGRPKEVLTAASSRAPTSLFRLSEVFAESVFAGQEISASVRSSYSDEHMDALVGGSLR